MHSSPGWPRGVVRPADLLADNTVLSDRLAQLEVRVNGKGVVGDAIKRPFILYRILLGLLPLRWQMWRPLSSYGDLATESRRILDTVGLLHLAAHPVSDIAYGERRRVELAMALAQKPRVLLLDEPLAGLSNTERSTVKSLIASIPRETTVVMIEHDMDTALDLAETVTLLNYGRVIVDGDRDAVIADERTREVYLGA